MVNEYRDGFLDPPTHLAVKNLTELAKNRVLAAKINVNPPPQFNRLRDMVKDLKKELSGIEGVKKKIQKPLPADNYLPSLGVKVSQERDLDPHMTVVHSGISQEKENNGLKILEVFFQT